MNYTAYIINIQTQSKKSEDIVNMEITNENFDVSDHTVS
jgi:hypothetical protein